MSESDSETAGQPPERTDERSVVESFDGIRDRRLKDIFQARKDVREVRNQIADRGLNAEGSAVYRGVLETYLTEVEPLFVQNEKGEFLWDEKKFGEIVLRPPGLFEKQGEAMLKTHGPRGSSAPGEPLKIPVSRVKGDELKPVGFTVKGLSSLFRLDKPPSYSWNVEIPLTGRRYSEEITDERVLSMVLLDEMFRTVNRYLAEVGVGMSLKEKQGPQNVEDTEF